MIKCPACGCHDKKAIEIISVPSQHLQYARGKADIAKRLSELLDSPSGQYTMYACSNCGLEYADPLHAPENEWYGLLYENEPLYPNDRWEFDFVGQKLSESDAVLDFGCGSGEFLSAIHRNVRDTLGVDFSDSAIHEVRNKGLRGVTVSELESVTQKYNVITSFHCLEHMPSPDILFAIAKRHATSDATLWVAVPSNRRPSRVFSESDYLDQPPHHMSRWNTTSLEFVAADSPWRLTNVVYEPSTLRAKVWEVSRRSPGYTTFSQANSFLERIYRAGVFLPILYCRQSLLKKLSGFAMLAKYELK